MYKRILLPLILMISLPATSMNDPLAALNTSKEIEKEIYHLQILQQINIALENGNSTEAERLANAGLDINYPCSNENTLLHLTAFFKFEYATAFLLRSGARIDIQNALGNTVLHMVAHGLLDQRGNPATCRLLVQHQQKNNAATKTLLLCLYRMRRDSENADLRMCFGELYRQFKTLLLPHLNYFPLKKLLNIRNKNDQRACDLQLESLNPELLNPEPNSSWFSNCSIQ